MINDEGLGASLIGFNLYASELTYLMQNLTLCFDDRLSYSFESSSPKHNILTLKLEDKKT